MTLQKVREVCDSYLELEKQRILHTNSPELTYAFRMCERIREHIENNKIEKSMRWLGFIQGVLYSNGVLSVEELKNHNRPQD